jgi:hypothetical protein
MDLAQRLAGNFGARLAAMSCTKRKNLLHKTGDSKIGDPPENGPCDPRRQCRFLGGSIAHELTSRRASKGGWGSSACSSKHSCHVLLMTEAAT